MLNTFYDIRRSKKIVYVQMGTKILSNQFTSQNEQITVKNLHKL